MKDLEQEAPALQGRYDRERPVHGLGMEGGRPLTVTVNLGLVQIVWRDDRKGCGDEPLWLGEG
jgi:hypothetical protein